MVGGMPLNSTDLAPGLTDLFSQLSWSRRGLEADFPMRVAERFRRCHRIALLRQRLGQGIKGERRHGGILDLQVVGKDESGHNKQCSPVTLAMGETDNEWLLQPCRDRIDVSRKQP